MPPAIRRIADIDFDELKHKPLGDALGELKKAWAKIESTKHTPLGQKVENPPKKEDFETIRALDILARDDLGREQKVEAFTSEWGKWRSRARDRVHGHMASWLLYVLTWAGKQRIRITPDNEIAPIGLPGWLPDSAVASINRLRPIITELASELLREYAVLEVMPRTASIADQDAARIATKHVHYWEDASDIKQVKKLCALWLAITGNAFVKVHWDPTLFGMVRGADGVRQRKQIGGIKFEFVVPYDILVSEDATGLDDTDRLVFETRRSQSWLERNYPEALAFVRKNEEGRSDRRSARDEWSPMQWEGKWNETLHQAIGRNDSVPMFQSANIDISDIFSKENNPAKPYLVAECYERVVDPDIGEYWWRSVFCSGYLLESEPYVPRDLQGNMVRDESGQIVTWPLPFIQHRYYTTPGRFFGSGVVRDMIDIDRLLADLDSYAKKMALDASMLLFTSGSGTEVTPITGRGWTVLRSGSMNPLNPVPMPGNLPALISLIEHFDSKMHDVALRPDVLQGRAGSRDSGKKVEILGEQASAAVDLIRSDLNRTWAQTYSLALEIMQHMATDQRLLELHSDEAGVYAFKGADIRGHTDVRMHLGGMFGVTRAERTQRASMLLQMGLITPEQAKIAMTAGAGEDFTDHERLQQSAARMKIYRIHDMSDEEASIIVMMIALVQAQAQEQALAEAQADGVQPDQSSMMAATIQAVNSLLLEFNLGLEPFEDFRTHTAEIQRYLLGHDARTMSVPRKTLLNYVWQSAGMTAGAPHMMRAAADQQRMEARQQRISAMGGPGPDSAARDMGGAPMPGVEGGRYPSRPMPAQAAM